MPPAVSHPEAEAAAEAAPPAVSRRGEEVVVGAAVRREVARREGAAAAAVAAAARLGSSLPAEGEEAPAATSHLPPPWVSRVIPRPPNPRLVVSRCS